MKKPSRKLLEVFSIRQNNIIEIFYHYKYNDNNTVIIDNQTKQIIFKFDSLAKMFNAKGVLVGSLQLDKNMVNKWMFCMYDETISKQKMIKVFAPKSRFTIDCEPEIVKWLIETNQIDILKLK